MYPGPPCILNPQTPPAGFPGTDLAVAPCAASTPFTTTPDSTRPNETVTWWGRIRRIPGAGVAWVISSTGSVPNPTGPDAAPVIRTLTAKVPVVFEEGHEAPPGILNWVYSAGPMTLDQHVNMYSPLFVDGDLTLHSNKPEIYGRLYVTGDLTLDSSADQFAIKETANIAVGGMTTHSKGIGASNKRVSEAHLQGGCQGNPICRWDAHNVYVDPAGSAGTTMPGLKRDQSCRPVL